MIKELYKSRAKGINELYRKSYKNNMQGLYTNHIQVKKKAYRNYFDIKRMQELYKSYKMVVPVQYQTYTKVFQSHSEVIQKPYRIYIIFIHKLYKSNHIRIIQESHGDHTEVIQKLYTSNIIMTQVSYKIHKGIFKDHTGVI